MLTSCAVGRVPIWKERHCRDGSSEWIGRREQGGGRVPIREGHAGRCSSATGRVTCVSAARNCTPWYPDIRFRRTQGCLGCLSTGECGFLAC